MTDLTTVLPGFPTQQYVRLLPSLEKHCVTTADLLTQDWIEIAKRAQLPLLDVKRLCNAVLDALQLDLGIGAVEDGDRTQESHNSRLRKSGRDLVDSWNTISTLDDDLDRALGGGIPAGYITEVTGESGAGKTQFLLTLLLSAQLPQPLGLSSPTLYISTESALPITRLSQLLRTHPTLASLEPKPSLDAVISIATPDLESQDHILRYQVPVAIRRHGIRLIILDSVAANYRAEFERPSAGGGHTNGANMAQRSADLVKLGQLLRDIAREHNIVVVVANQVADRFSSAGSSTADGSSPVLYRNPTQSSPLARRSAGTTVLPSSAPTSSASHPPPSTPHTPFAPTPDPMSLDHQQRWFTGWGDDLHASRNLKTPSLGLIWTTQIACRIALIKKPVYGPGLAADEENEAGELVLRRWRRWMKVVFAPHAKASGPRLRDAVEFEIRGDGVRAVEKVEKVGEGGDDGDGDGDGDVDSLPV
ncbi:uncharacterized protein BP5553_02882 [Venustampulla echinocandica]|uniref:RecA family profile 1 domain-containing protein n=1 Tax=Venustampulla echinocandica TaxID=2656787 RepID=A0A370TSM9_9HELO|nr:uncharacterized protein BP5553_02882 [Venustampulla echinocandica]RDL38542.1 hypothetical protein BP5553_02882 [Venustampulla echinocandica]